MKFYIVIFSVLCGGFFVQASSPQNISWARIHRHYQAPRALGMGDAFVAVSNDYSAIFYNPAGLSRIKETQVNMSIDFGVTNSFETFYKEIDRIGSISDTNQKSSAYVDLLQKNYGQIYGARMGLLHGAIASPGWGFAILPMDLTVEFSVQNQAFPALATRVTADSTIAYGYGTRVMSDDLGGKLDWGVTGKMVHRGYLNMDLNVLDLILDPEILNPDRLTQGYALDADIGFLYSPFLEDGWFSQLLGLARPTFGVVFRNVLGGQFYNTASPKSSTGSVQTQTPERLQPVMDIGTRWEYPEVWIFSGRGVMDFRNIGHTHYSFKKGLHLGFEFDWRVASWWNGQYRIGLSQGYLTTGLSALLGVWRLDLVTYGEEAGVERYPKESRIYMARFNLDF
jgi:hypothetical protein